MEIIWCLAKIIWCVMRHRLKKKILLPPSQNMKQPAKEGNEQKLQCQWKAGPRPDKWGDQLRQDEFRAVPMNPTRGFQVWVPCLHFACLARDLLRCGLSFSPRCRARVPVKWKTSHCLVQPEQNKVKALHMKVKPKTPRNARARWCQDVEIMPTACCYSNHAHCN